jgi:hypothetical protein
VQIVQSWSQDEAGDIAISVTGVTPGNMLLAAVTWTDGRSAALLNPPTFNGSPFAALAGNAGGYDIRPSTAIYSVTASAASGTVAQVDRPGTTRFKLYEVSGLGNFIGGASSPDSCFVGPASIALSVSNTVPSVGFVLAMRGSTAPGWSGWSENFTNIYPENISTTSRGTAFGYRETSGDHTVTGSITAGFLGVSFAVFEDVGGERQRSRLILTPW